jgi:phospholipase C
MDDKTKSFTCGSIFGALSDHNIDWKIYGYDDPPDTRHDFPDTTNAADSHFGLFADFETDAAQGRLAAYSFLEPEWSVTGNSQHPNFDVSKGEQFIKAVYTALRGSPVWHDTLLIITYGEHGGCYDHVAPLYGAVPPDHCAASTDVISGASALACRQCWFRRASNAGRSSACLPVRCLLDHTSILRTIGKRWDIPPLSSQ